MICRRGGCFYRECCTRGVYVLINGIGHRTPWVLVPGSSGQFYADGQPINPTQCIVWQMSVALEQKGHHLFFVACRVGTPTTPGLLNRYFRPLCTGHTFDASRREKETAGIFPRSKLSSGEGGEEPTQG